MVKPHMELGLGPKNETYCPATFWTQQYRCENDLDQDDDDGDDLCTVWWEFISVTERRADKFSIGMVIYKVNGEYWTCNILQIAWPFNKEMQEINSMYEHTLLLLNYGASSEEGDKWT